MSRMVFSMLSLLPALLLFSQSASAAIKPYINTQTEIPTECKTCPRSLCPNVVAYDWEVGFNVTCWTRGTNIMGNKLWLKTGDGCYVTQWDLIDYAGEYDTDLAYCGRDSEEEHLTIEPATLQYKTECSICPTISCDVVAYLPEETDVDLTCYYPDGYTIIDDPYWLKTTNNCYVARKNLYSKPDITYLDNCGPIPISLEISNHNNENGTSDVNKRSAAPAPVPATKLEDRAAHYLVNVTVGEDIASCRSCPKASCNVEKRYKFDQEVWLQCLVNTNGTWWSETTDFCYVQNSDFWQSPEGDFYANPLCEYFPGGEPSTKD